MNIRRTIDEYDAKFSEAQQITKEIESKDKDYNLQDIIEYIKDTHMYQIFDCKSIDMPDKVTRFGNVIIYEYYSYGYIDVIGLTKEDYNKVSQLEQFNY